MSEWDDAEPDSATEKAIENAVEYLRDKTAEDLLDIELLLIESDSLDLTITGTFEQACVELERVDHERVLAFGLLLAEHPNPEARKAAYRELSRLQPEFEEAERTIVGMLDDSDEGVVAFYLEALDAELARGSARRSFASSIDLLRRINAARDRAGQ